MKFKKIYIEITNICNLNCSFCDRTKKEKREMSLDSFEHVLKEIGDMTSFIYLHVQGEPLMHSKLKEILELCHKYKKKVNITTNGTLLKEKYEILNMSPAIRQINISLHSYNGKDNYFNDVFDTVSKLKNIYIVYRIWVNSNNNIILEKLKEYFQDIVFSNKTNIKLANNIYLDKQEEFIWPNLNNNYNKEGMCLGLKTHIAILVDGTVTVCCLDANGISNLGNIFKENLKDILNNEKTKNIIKNFNNNKCYLDICKHCSYKDRFNK